MRSSSTRRPARDAALRRLPASALRVRRRRADRLLQRRWFRRAPLPSGRAAARCVRPAPPVTIDDHRPPIRRPADDLAHEDRHRHRRRHGIGKAVALALLNDGLSRRARRPAPRARSTRRSRRIGAARAGAHWPCRPTSATRRRCSALFAKAKEPFGRLDLLFNNAGVGAPGVNLEEL